MTTITPIETLFETDHLRISYLPGDGDGMVVAFTGIKQQLGKIQDEEFIGIGSQHRENHVVFVTDKQCSWYSHPDLPGQIVEQVLRVATAKGVTSMLTLGNSMGGYGALLFAERLNASVAIGFSPQYSMHHDVIADGRWKRFRPFMFDAGLDSLGNHLTGKLPTFALLGAREAMDMEHLNLLKNLGHTVIWKMERCGHGVAAFLKDRNILSEVFGAMKAVDHNRLTTLLGEFGLAIYPSDQPANTRGIEVSL